MSKELERRLQDRLPGIPLNRKVVRRFEEVATNTGLAVFKDDAAAFVATNNLQNLSALIDEARALSGNDPAKQALCLQVIQDYAADSRRAQSLLGW